MKVEIGFQPNCSETVFRFSRKELGKLSPDELKAFWVAAANGCTAERLSENAFASLGLPHTEPTGGEYGSLCCQSDDHFILAYYQMSNEMLLEFAKNHLKDWLTEAPFSQEETIPKDHDFEYYEDQPLPTIFKGNSLPPEGFEAIIELRKLAGESAQKKKGCDETLKSFENTG